MALPGCSVGGRVDEAAAFQEARCEGLGISDAERPGVYFRVISPGDISAGDRVRLIPVAKGIVTTQDLFHFVYERNPDPARLRSFLDAPVASRMRGQLESKLDSTV